MLKSLNANQITDTIQRGAILRQHHAGRIDGKGRQIMAMHLWQQTRQIAPDRQTAPDMTG